MAKEEARAKGEFVREVIRQYIKLIKRDRRWKQLRKWGKETVKESVSRLQGFPDFLRLIEIFPGENVRTKFPPEAQKI